jgi:hypothetical protein
MSVPPPELLDKLCFVIHRSCVEIRQFVGEGRHDQAVDLADAIEHVPGYLPSWKDEFLIIIIDSFQRYMKKYENISFNYVDVLLSNSDAFHHNYGRWRGER